MKKIFKGNKMKKIICVGLCLFTTAVMASSNVVKLVVPFSAGGATDQLARAIVPYLSEGLKKTIIIENKPGASGAIGTASVVNNSSPDDTVLVINNLPLVTNPIINKGARYDMSQLVPLIKFGYIPSVLAVSSRGPIKNIEQWKSLDSSKVLMGGSAGIMTLSHLYLENL
jgi:tripartite-type tricarboxylate transporter receptor subunit TctC